MFLAVGAFALLFAACEGGGPTSVSACPKLEAPTLTSPANGANMPQQPTLQWEDIENESSYTLEVYESSNCSGNMAYESTSISAGTTSHTVTYQLTGQLSWHVIAVGDCESGTGFSDSSASECRFFTSS